MRGIFSNLAVMNKFFGSDHEQRTIQRVDTETFRNVMREVAAHVSIVAAGAPGNRNGLTATAICPVSDTPPTLLVCVKNTAQAHDVIEQSGCFSINFLSSEQKDIATRFSGAKGVHGEDRFSIGHWSTNLTGAPLLEDTVCSLECQLVDQRSVATHTIFFGELVGGYMRNDASALLYLQGGYRSLGPITLSNNSSNN